MSKPTFKNTLVRNYLKKFPNTGSRTIARKIYAENSEHFSSERAVRTMVMYIRGLSGDKNRKKLKDKSLAVKKFSIKNPYDLPKSDAQKPKVFTLPKQCSRILVLSDLHIPYHDIQALTTALNYGKKQDANTIFINGDLIDFYQISRFTNLERKRSVSDELEITREFLSILRKTFPKAKIYFLKGNHDNRLEYYLATKAPELLDVEEFRLKELLQLDKFGVEIFDETTLIKAGKLAITHGHLLLRGVFSPVNPARGSFLKAKASVLIGHSHKVSTHTETTINGKTIACYSTGSLCELCPSYQPFSNNFMHGFAFIEVQRGGHYKVKNIQIIDGVMIN
jgi:predicted phosphodiesterase